MELAFYSRTKRNVSPNLHVLHVNLWFLVKQSGRSSATCVVLCTGGLVYR